MSQPQTSCTSILGSERNDEKKNNNTGSNQSSIKDYFDNSGSQVADKVANYVTDMSNMQFCSIVQSQNMLSYISQTSTSSISRPEATSLVEVNDEKEK